MIRRWMIACVVVLAGAARLPAEPAASPDSAGYFPLAAGTTWKYQVASKSNEVAAKPYVQTLSAAAAIVAGEASVVPVGDELYLLKEDGVYLFGRRNGQKIEPLDQPQKVLPLRPRSGDTWNYLAKTQSTYATCLGNRPVKVEAGEFETQCIFASTAGLSEGLERQTYRYFARGVGLVRETITEQVRLPDGKVQKLEFSRDLVAFSPPGTPAPATTQAATAPAASPEFLAAFDAGRQLAEKAEHAAALVKFDQAIAIDPTQPRAFACKGLSLLALHRAEEAARAIDVAMKLAPADFRYVAIAGQVAITRGQVREGKALFARAAGMSPRDAGGVWADLAAALAQRNDDALAGEIEAALKAAAAADPPSLDALFALGQSCAAAGRQEGRAYLRRYLDLANQLPEAERDARKLQLARQMIKALEAIEDLPK